MKPWLLMLAAGRTPAAGFVFLLALGIGLAGCSSGEKAAAGGDGAVAVKVYAVEEQVVKRAVQATGSLFALEESVISAEVEGRVERVAADVGDQVQQGQELVLLSPVELRLEAERQRAAVQQVRARLGIGANDALPRHPDQVAFVQRAAADLSDAEQKHRRAEELHRNQLISQQEFDASQARHKGARAAYDEAVQMVDQLKAQLQSSEAARTLAEKKLDDATIRAPFHGAVKERRISPGEFVRVQSPVMVIVRTDQLRARLAVPEKWAGSLKAGVPVDVRVEAYPNEVFRGRVERINPAVSADTRTFEVQAILRNGDARLKPGFFAQATMPSELQEKSLTLPEEAVTYRYGVYKAFFVEGNQVDEREVKTGAQGNGRIEILGGAKAGDRVAVAAPGGALRDGVAIKQ